MRHLPALLNKQQLLGLFSVYRYSDLPKIAGLVVLYALITEITIRFFSADGTVILIWPASWLAFFRGFDWREEILARCFCRRIRGLRDDGRERIGRHAHRPRKHGGRAGRGADT